MTLNEKDKKLFEAMTISETGRLLTDYINRAKADMFDPETLTPENLPAKKEAWSFIENYILSRLGNFPKDKKGEPNQYM